jgi:putative ABC transport system permease protein
MPPRYAKVWRDLFANPTRTMLVVISIAVGVFAFGTILSALTIIFTELRSSYLTINPTSAIITTTSFDDDLVDAVRRVPGVATAQGQRAVAARLRTGPAEWIDLQLFVLPDDGAMTINIVRPEAGAWPPPDKTILIERSSLAKVGAAIGTSVHVELPGQDGRDLPLAGLTYDLSLPPAAIAGNAVGYVTDETLSWLGGDPAYNQLLFVVSENRTDEAHIQAVAGQIERVIERSGREVLVTDVPTPLQHPAEVVLPIIGSILTILGLLALLISGFLIINTITAILTQQTRQIGIMKAIGARTGQIMGLYFGLVTGFGLLALCIAIPLGAAGAYGLSRFIASQLNVELQGTLPPLQIVGLQVVAGLLVPILSAAVPIRATARLTVREAISGVNTEPRKRGKPGKLQNGSAEGEEEPKRMIRLPRLISLSRPMQLSLRNTFRRRGRLIRTMAALSLGGAVFITVITLNISLYSTLDESIASQQYDLEAQFGRSYRDIRAAQDARGVAGVTHVESLLRAQVFPVRADGSTGEVINLRALPANTSLLAPRMTAGSWLRPDDERGIVISTNYLTKERNTRIGDTITLQIANKNYEWQIVGLIEEFLPPTSPSAAYVNLAGYTRAVGGVGRTDTLRIATTGHDPQAHAAATAALEQHMTERGYNLRLIRSRSDDRAILSERFMVLTGVLSLMSLIIGSVGGLGLAGTMSINVLERTREIGIMRAIGASDGSIQQIVIGEGVMIGFLAWLVGTLLSIPLSYGMCYQFGMQLLNTPLTWRYSLLGVGLWLGIVLLIATLASFLPARNASRLTVREVLAYE